MDPRLARSRFLYLSLSFSLSVPLSSRGRRRPHEQTLQREFAALASADPNLRYLLYGAEEKRVSTADALHTASRDCHMN